MGAMDKNSHGPGPARNYLRQVRVFAAGLLAAVQSGVFKMKFQHLIILAAVPASLTAAAPAEAKGCIRGAVAGAVAGHYAHHHAIAGAAAGCAAGHYYYKHKARKVAATNTVKPAAAAH